MSRAGRIPYPGAMYHVLSRGNERRDIFMEVDDRQLFLDTLAEISDRFEVNICAFVLIGNHYHPLLRTRWPNLSKAMQRKLDSGKTCITDLFWPASGSSYRSRPATLPGRRMRRSRSRNP